MMMMIYDPFGGPGLTESVVVVVAVVVAAAVAVVVSCLINILIVSPQLHARVLFTYLLTYLLTYVLIRYLALTRGLMFVTGRSAHLWLMCVSFYVYNAINYDK